MGEKTYFIEGNPYTADGLMTEALHILSDKSFDNLVMQINKDFTKRELVPMLIEFIKENYATEEVLRLAVMNGLEYDEERNDENV